MTRSTKYLLRCAILRKIGTSTWSTAELFDVLKANRAITREDFKEACEELELAGFLKLYMDGGRVFILRSNLIN